MLDVALELLEMGLSVIPLTKKTNLPPAGCTWLEQQDKLPEEDIVTQRFTDNPGCNIGIITGAASRVVVIDGDSQEACKWIEKTFPNTWLTVTNSGRGKHYYYRYPALNNGNYIKTSSSALFQEVDVRGDKGLVVVPPSIHKSSNSYVWNIVEGFSLDDLSELPECPVDIPGIVGNRNGHDNDGKIKSDNHGGYVPGELKNIADQCTWLQHCRIDAKTLGYDEWRWMLSIVSRCIDGRAKAHILSKAHEKYNYEQTDRKINEVLQNMGPATCRTIVERFKGCLDCPNILKGIKFSPEILAAESVIEEPEIIELVTADDINQQQSLNLKLPEEIINPGGLISLGMEALASSGIPNIAQYNYPIVISAIARAISGKIICNNVWPNLYNIKVGGTSTGKSESDKILRRAIVESGKFENFYGVTDFSSGPGLLRGLSENPKCLINLDEISYLFKRFDKPDPISSGKISALLELYSQSGVEIKKSYGSAKNNITINCPCVSILGNATPGIFDNIKNEDFESGLIQRFDFWYYAGDILKRDIIKQISMLNMDSFIEQLSIIFSGDIHGQNELEKAIGVPYSVIPKGKCAKQLQNFSDYIVEKSNKMENDGEKGIVSRGYHTAIKYALCHMVSDRGYPMFYEDINSNDLDYGIKVATLISDWKLETLISFVSQGAFHRNWKIFKSAIAGAIKADKRPSGKILINRRKQLKNIKSKDWDEIVKVLVARKEIFLEEFKGKTIYWLRKTSKDGG